MKERIMQIMQSLNMNQQDFAKEIGISAGSLSSILKGRNNPTLNHVEAIIKRFPNISLDWLVKGEGDMYVNNADAGTSDNGGRTQGTAQEQTLSFDGTDSLQQPVDNASSGKNVQIAGQYNRNILMNNINKPPRKVTSIQIIYDDNTIEIFEPKK